MGNQWHQHLNSFSSMLHLSYQNKQPMTPSAFFDQLAQQACSLAALHALALCVPRVQPRGGSEDHVSSCSLRRACVAAEWCADGPLQGCVCQHRRCPA